MDGWMDGRTEGRGMLGQDRQIARQMDVPNCNSISQPAAYDICSRVYVKALHCI